MPPTIESKVAEFRSFCRSDRITLEDVQEVSWAKAEKHLLTFLKHGAGELHHSALIGMFKAWEETGS